MRATIQFDATLVDVTSAHSLPQVKEQMVTSPGDTKSDTDCSLE